MMAAHRELCTLFRDAGTGAAPASEIAWYTARLPRGSGPNLAAMCGSGRLLVPLVLAKQNVHGVDASAPMLASCAARLAGAGVNTPLFRQDVGALNLPFRYAGAFVAAGSFQLLSDLMSAQAALERIRVHLVDPAVLLLDLFVPAEAAHPPGAPAVEAHSVTLPDGSRIARRSETFVDTDGRRLDIRTRYERRMRATIMAREDEALALTWYTEDEIVAMLTDAGFRDVTVGASPRAADEDIREGERRFSVSARA
jgi:hypothetical protein